MPVIRLESHILAYAARVGQEVIAREAGISTSSTQRALHGERAVSSSHIWPPCWPPADWVWSRACSSPAGPWNFIRLTAHCVGNPPRPLGAGGFSPWSGRGQAGP
jgi:hypothetical protein